MLLTDILSLTFGLLSAGAAVVILILADTGPLGTPSPGAVMFAAVLAIMALMFISLPVLRPRHL